MQDIVQNNDKHRDLIGHVWMTTYVECFVWKLHIPWAYPRLLFFFSTAFVRHQPWFSRTLNVLSLSRIGFWALLIPSLLRISGTYSGIALHRVVALKAMVCTGTSFSNADRRPSILTFWKSANLGEIRTFLTHEQNAVATAHIQVKKGFYWCLWQKGLGDSAGCTFPFSK